MKSSTLYSCGDYSLLSCFPQLKINKDLVSIDVLFVYFFLFRQTEESLYRTVGGEIQRIPAECSLRGQ